MAQQEVTELSPPETHSGRLAFFQLNPCSWYSLLAYEVKCETFTSHTGQVFGDTPILSHRHPVLSSYCGISILRFLHLVIFPTCVAHVRCYTHIVLSSPFVISFSCYPHILLFSSCVILILYYPHPVLTSSCVFSSCVLSLTQDSKIPSIIICRGEVVFSHSNLFSLLLVRPLFLWQSKIISVSTEILNCPRTKPKVTLLYPCISLRCASDSIQFSRFQIRCGTKTPFWTT